MPASSSVAGVDPYIGNLVLGIYHLQDCDWVNRISGKNRVGFTTSTEAISHGFKPCRVCWPQKGTRST
jgi:methylphosphotriester-DNA--protein-cysteine methyltransferase